VNHGQGGVPARRSLRYENQRDGKQQGDEVNQKHEEDGVERRHGSLAMARSSRRHCGTAGEEDGIQVISAMSGDVGWLKGCARRWQSGGRGEL
jgi:hypothetical protein